MSEKSEKFVALAVGLGVICSIVAWRTLRGPEAGYQVEASAKDTFSATVLNEKEAPESYKSEAFFGLKSVEGLAAEKLAELELHDARAELERARAAGEDFGPVRNKEMRLGANVKVLGPVEDGPDGGTARMIATLYLVHAGPFPAEQAAAKHQKVCTVVEVDPTGDAYAGGLRLGDVWVQIDATDLLGSKSDDPCKELTATSKASATGADLKFVVFRAAQKTELKLHKGSDRLKFVAIPVPVLDADKAAAPRP